MSGRVVALLLGILLAAFGGPDSAWAASSWRASFSEGRAALKQQRYGDALVAFEECLDEARGEAERWHALVALGLSHELMGEPIRALGRYWRFVEEAGASARAQEDFWAAKLREVRATVTSLEAGVLKTRARVRFTVTPEDARLRLDGSAMDPARYYYVNPGRHALEVTLEGFEAVREEFAVQAGDVRVVSVGLERVPQPEPPEEEVVPEPEVPSVVKGPDPVAPAPDRTASWALFGVGAASLVAGAVLTGVTAVDVGEMEDLSARPGTPASVARYRELEGRARATQTASWVAYGVGAVAVVTGVVLFVTGEAEPGEGIALRF